MKAEGLSPTSPPFPPKELEIVLEGFSELLQASKWGILRPVSRAQSWLKFKVTQFMSSGFYCSESLGWPGEERATHEKDAMFPGLPASCPPP